MRSVVLLGATGSIGQQTLDVIRANPDEFSVELLSVHSRVEELLLLVEEFAPRGVVVGDVLQAGVVRSRFPGLDVGVGAQGLAEAAAAFPGALVINALLGAAGVIPTLRALASGCDVALANKETLVCAGDLVRTASERSGATVIPVDSEHSALLQCLKGAQPEQVERLVLTASGGPFRSLTYEQMRTVTVADALRHPTWRMGAKISIDSATLMNKGLEVIEAHQLYGTPYDRIAIIVHPQSVIHSMVEFVDGSLLAHLGSPDMRVPIAYAMFGGHRRGQGEFRALRLEDLKELSFEEPDFQRFPALGVAYECGRAGGTAPAIMNAANEVAVAEFLAGRLDFLGILEVVRRVVERVSGVATPDLDTILAKDAEARRTATEMIRERGLS
ncbi:MAG: 1-deoxy-D-xylulose-5-phosphate reductoisomerase [Firmicutes bacterium]|nr:1-deoxy-D-xylulose-5-phosphate reductoisomerase [Bacillota bacterium]